MEITKEDTSNKINNKEQTLSTLKKITKILNYIGKVLSYASIILLVIIGIFLVYYLITMQKVKKNPKYKPEVSLYTIISGSMEPAIHVYDVVVNVATKSPEDIKVGDIITFISTSSISEGLTITHRVQDIRIVNGEYEFVTKGDYNPVADSKPASYSNVIGKVAFKIPQLGRIQFLVASKAGWFLIVLLPAMGVIIYDVIKLIKLLGAKATSDKVKNKKKNHTGDKDVDKALENIIKKDYSSNIDEMKNDLKNYNLLINNDINENKDKDETIVENKIENKENEEVHISKQEYLNRLNALKNKK